MASILRVCTKTIEPTILYFGTPVALISTLNPDVDRFALTTGKSQWGYRYESDKFGLPD